MKRLIATFRPQVWINDYAVDLQKDEEFDATNELLSLPLEKIQSFQEHNQDSDDLARNLPSRIDHAGPFEVDVDIDQWLHNLGFPERTDLTPELLLKLKGMFLQLTPKQYQDLVDTHKILAEKACKLAEERFNRNPPPDYNPGIFILRSGEFSQDAVEVRITYPSKKGNVETTTHINIAELI